MTSEGASGSPSRASSTESSALSHITVGMPALTTSTAAEAAPVSMPTPPTSVSDRQSLASAEPSSGRPKRKRPVSSYNLKELSDAQQPIPVPAAAGSRNVSGLTGRTLVDGSDAEDETATPRRKAKKAIEQDVEAPVSSFDGELPQRPTRQPSIKDRFKNATRTVKTAVSKRTREAYEAGKKTLGLKNDEDKPSKALKQLDMGKRGVLDELDLDAEFAAPPPRPTKRPKTDHATAKELARPLISGAMQKTSDGRAVKKWQNQGLYVGQDAADDYTQGSAPKRLQKKRPTTASSEDPTTSIASVTENVASKLVSDKPKKTQSFMPLPMFGRLEKEREFIIPYDIFAPAPPQNEKPKDWSKLNRNQVVKDAKDQWDQWKKDKGLPTSACVCSKPAPGEQGCEEDCLNRVMQYECNENNCHLSPDDCSNRAFHELATRVSDQANRAKKVSAAYNIGVEVIKTGDRGFGVRASRSFHSGQIIMEYTGEVITEEECQRRMREVYKDKRHYYLMELERNLVIDGTKGSMARFINHSCEPNCEVRMVKVGGVPRMGVFAGVSGIMTGEELTYDYNFDNFGDNQQKCYCGAASCRGTLSRRLNAAEQKKQAREELERKRKAEVEAQKHAEEEQRRKKVKTDRGSSWRGWVAVDDAEVKEKLKQEKKAREEEEKNSTRAKRAAARRGEVPAQEPAKPASLGRRKTTTTLSELPVAHVAGDEAADAKEERPLPKPKSAARRKTTSLSGLSLVQADKVDAPDSEADGPPRKKSKALVRKKSTAPAPPAAVVAPSPSEDESEVESPPKVREKSPKRRKHLRTTSTGSKFTEQLDAARSTHSRPSSSQAIMKKTTFTSTTSTLAESATYAPHGNGVTLSNSVSITEITAVSGKAAAENDGEGEGEAKPKRRSMLGSLGSKMKQSTLNFGKSAGAK